MTTTKITAAQRNANLLAGVQKRFPTLNMPQFPIAGTMYSLAQILAILQPVIDGATTAVNARGAWQLAVRSERSLAAQSRAFFTALRQTIYVLYGSQPDALADFGLLPKKARKPRTPAARVVAAAKSKATRKARNPIPKKDLHTVHGQVGDTISVSVQGTPAILPTPVAPTTGGSAANGAGTTAASTPAGTGNGAAAAPAGANVAGGGHS